MNYKSHTKKDLIEAQKKGEKLWSLDTGNDGEDDVLIGEKEDVIQEILYFHDIGTNVPKLTWEGYCEEIGVEKRGGGDEI